MIAPYAAGRGCRSASCTPGDTRQGATNEGRSGTSRSRPGAAARPSLHQDFAHGAELDHLNGLGAGLVPFLIVTEIVAMLLTAVPSLAWKVKLSVPDWPAIGV